MSGMELIALGIITGIMATFVVTLSNLSNL